MKNGVKYLSVGALCLALSWVLLIVFIETPTTEFQGTILSGRVKVIRQIPYRVQLIEGEVKRKACRSYGQEIDIETHFFNKKGLLIESIFIPTPTKSTEPRAIKFKYLPNGKLKCREYYSLGGTLINIQKLEYSNNGKQIIERSNDRLTKFKLNDASEIIEEYNYRDEVGLEFRDTFQYKNGFLVLHDIHYLGAGWHLSNIYERDKMGNLKRFALRSSIEDTNKLTWHTFKYEYDRKGNWVKRVRYRFGKPYYLVIREIEYY